uniref:Uncharacterized protein n=1 Tax=Arundo donax TaxID=35708 RepID=A0A0A9FCF6_ARUDO
MPIQTDSDSDNDHASFVQVSCVTV